LCHVASGALPPLRFRPFRFPKIFGIGVDSVKDRLAVFPFFQFAPLFALLAFFPSIAHWLLL